jgi:peroxiredoxin family protein
MSGASVHPIETEAELRLASPTEEPGTAKPAQEGLSMVVFSGELDKVLAAFIIANGAAAMDLPVNMFFTFWGLNVLRREGPVAVARKKTMSEGMFSRMMPRGPDHLHLSQMNMAGLGTRMMKREMTKKHVNSLAQLMQSAQQQGVRLIACTMTMNLMGIREEELMPGIEYGNVGSFIDSADRSRITLFV